MTRSSGLNGIGVALPPKTAAPPGVSQICSVSCGQWMLNESVPQTSSNSGRYLACDNRNAMQAVSGKTHFLGIDRRMLCLLGVSALQLVSGRACIPEISAKEGVRNQRGVELQHWEIGRIRVALRYPLAGAKVKRSRIGDHRQVDGRDRSAKAGVRHMAGAASLIFEGRNGQVEVQQLSEYFDCII